MKENLEFCFFLCFFCFSIFFFVHPACPLAKTNAKGKERKKALEKKGRINFFNGFKIKNSHNSSTSMA